MNSLRSALPPMQGAGASFVPRKHPRNEYRAGSVLHRFGALGRWCGDPPAAVCARTHGGPPPRVGGGLSGCQVLMVSGSLRRSDGEREELQPSGEGERLRGSRGGREARTTRDYDREFTGARLRGSAGRRDVARRWRQASAGRRVLAADDEVPVEGAGEWRPSRGAVEGPPSGSRRVVTVERRRALSRPPRGTRG